MEVSGSIPGKGEQVTLEGDRALLKKSGGRAAIAAESSCWGLPRPDCHC